MIVLDTHVWAWWVHGDVQLPKGYRDSIQAHETDGLGVSIISCWEMAKLVEYRWLKLPVLVAEWFDQALAYPGIQLLELTPRIAVESTQLPGVFHRDPVDQMIVATARVYNCPLVTVDDKVRAYPYVRLQP